ERVLAQTPRDAELIAYRADCLRELGQWTAARRAYARALALDPLLAHAHANLGPLLLLRGETKAALRHCTRATQLDPHSATGWANLAHCRAELEQFDPAMQAYAEAYARAEHSAELCCRIAAVWQKVGEYEQAALWLSRAGERQPDARCVRTGAASLLLESGNS